MLIAMRRFKSTRLLLFGMVLMLANSRSANAAGTPAGTVISSRATATYATITGAHTDTVYSAYVTFTVKQLAVVNVLPASLSRNSGDGATVDFGLTVVNSGNGTDKFTLAAVSSRGWQILLYHDFNGNGSLDAADSSAGAITSTDSVKADSSFKIVARTIVPDNEALNGVSDSTTVTSISQFDAAKNANTVLIAHVQTALISTTASLGVDNVTPAPPGPITYTMSITNSGSIAATNVVLADKLDARLTYTGSTNGGVHIGSDSVRWTLGTIAAGGSARVTVTANVQTLLAPGTVIANSMNLTYGDGTLLRNKNSNVVNISVNSSFGVSMSPDSTFATKEPTDTAKYYFTVRNTGNIKDVIELAAVSSQSLSWSFYKDANNNRILDAADPLLTNTNAKAGVDVDSLAALDSVHVFAVAVIPFVLADQTKDLTTFAATSSGDGSKSYSAAARTTIDIPVVSVAISVSPPPTQPQPPGATLTYTLSFTNTGHADIDTSYSISARIPDSTSFVMRSAKLGTLTLADTSAVHNGVLSVKTGGLKQSSSGTVEFKVKIK